MDRKTEVRTGLRAAFKDLRSQGLIARMNYMCCSNCAGYNLTQQAVKKIQKGTPQEEIKGCAFWHNQDEMNWKETGKLMIGYGDMNSHEFGAIGLETKKVGEIIVEALSHSSTLCLAKC